MSKWSNKSCLHAELDAFRLVEEVAARTGETKSAVLTQFIRYAYSRARFLPVQIVTKERLVFDEVPDDLEHGALGGP